MYVLMSLNILDKFTDSMYIPALRSYIFTSPQVLKLPNTLVTVHAALL